MTDDKTYKDYTAGQQVTARVVEVLEQEVLLIVEEAVPGVLPVARPINFAVNPPRHLLPGDTLALTVKRQDRRQRRLVLALDDGYAARLREADAAQIAGETRRAIMLMSQQRALALDDDHSPDDDLFFDFESRRVVHGSHSQPYLLEEDLDNPADMLYQQIDELDEDGEDDEDDDHYEDEPDEE